MSSSAFKCTFDEIILYKFKRDVISSNSQDDFINIIPQTLEVNIFESIFSPVIKAELILSDAIGLFNNFPLTGEEIVYISYRTISNQIRQEWMVIESVKDITISDDNRSMVYMLNCVSIEAWANSRNTVQQAYKGISSDVVSDIFNQYIEKPLKNILPSIKVKNFIPFPTTEREKMWIIPNIKPFAAINMIAGLSESINKSEYSYLFYQNKDGYFFRTMQDMFDRHGSNFFRKKALDNNYKYISDEIEQSERMTNENRIVTNIVFNKRHSSIDKISMGYFQNKLFEINMRQKAYYISEKTKDDCMFIEDYNLNTVEYEKLVKIDHDEQANKVNYFINNQAENDFSFPVSHKREKWGRDLISHIAMSQIDITVTIPGNPILNVGELFYLEFPKTHGFNNNDVDELLSGYFLITEKRDSIIQNGDMSTSLRLQKDSYASDVNFKSKYKKNVIPV